MEINDPQAASGIAQWAYAAITAVVAAVVAIPKMLRGWSADKAGRVVNEAQADIVTALREELQHYRDDIAQLRAEVEALRGENATLKTQVAALRERITLLTEEHKGA